jgi:chemotaxis protein MotB
VRHALGIAAQTVRRILEEEGLPAANLYAVAAKADTDPLFPDDPYRGQSARHDHSAA